MTNQSGSRRRRRRLAAVVVGGLLALGPASGADARCVTVGIDGIGHTQCNLP